MSAKHLERLLCRLRVAPLALVFLTLMPIYPFREPLLLVQSQGPWIPGRPYINIELAEVAFVDNGELGLFDLTLYLRNVGGLTAGQVAIRVRPNESVSPIQGSGLVPVGRMYPDDGATVTLRMVQDELDHTGHVLLTVELEYIDSEGRRYTDEQVIRIQLAPRGWNQPQLMIAHYTTNPERPAPGEMFTLVLRIANVGPGDAKQVVLHLGGEEGLEPFIPIVASNVRFTPDLLPGTDEDISLSLLVDGEAEGGTYPIEIILNYNNVLGVGSTEKETIGLVVITRPMLKVDLFEPMAEPLVVGEVFEIPIEVINAGRHLARVSTVELSSETLVITGGSLYLGPLDPGTSGALVADAVADQAGTANATVFVHYLDDLNQPQKVVHELTFEIEPGIQPQEIQPGTEDVTEQNFLQRLGQVLLGLFGLGE